MECMYINPWRKNRDGTPHYQKSEPRLKSAFADRRKRRVHSRSEFRSREVVAHVGNVFACYTGGWMPYTVYFESQPLGIGAGSISHMNQLIANVRNTDICNGKTVCGAESFTGIPMPERRIAV